MGEPFCCKDLRNFYNAVRQDAPSLEALLDALEKHLPPKSGIAIAMAP